MKRLLCAMAFVMSGHAYAAIWSDMWWTPAESGWGLNVTQQANVMFLTWYVYRQNGQAVWYSGAVAAGPVQPNGYPVYIGSLFETTGPSQLGPFDPALVQGRKVGDVTFIPLASHRATLSYTVDGVVITKSIERLTFAHIPLTGRYLGGLKAGDTCGSISGFFGVIDLRVTAGVNADGVSGPLGIDIHGADGGYVCTLQGNYRQYGSIFQVATVAACNFIPGTGTLGINDLSRSDEGIQGDFVGPGLPGCSLRFSATQVQ